MNVEAFIRQSAARGLSRSAVAAALDMSMTKFRPLLDALPDIQWPAPGESVDFRRSCEARRGRFTPTNRAALEKARAVSRAKSLRTVRGVTGTIDELVQAFGIEVSASTVRRRMQEGMPLEAALFTPRQPWCRPNQRGCRFVKELTN
ncbi:hypothetical protein [Pseudomonas aeruginosa]